MYGLRRSRLAAQIACWTASGAAAGAKAMPFLMTPTSPGTVGRSIAGTEPKAAPPAWSCGVDGAGAGAGAASDDFADDVVDTPAPPVAAADIAGAQARPTVVRPSATRVFARN